MSEFTFYGTFGSGQVGYPGYLRVSVEAETFGEAYQIAYQRMNKATDRKWCALYDSLDKMHYADKVYRGKC